MHFYCTKSISIKQSGRKCHMVIVAMISVSVEKMIPPGNRSSVPALHYNTSRPNVLSPLILVDPIMSWRNDKKTWPVYTRSAWKVVFMGGSVSDGIILALVIWTSRISAGDRHAALDGRCHANGSNKPAISDV